MSVKESLNFNPNQATSKSEGRPQQRSFQDLQSTRGAPPSCIRDCVFTVAAAAGTICSSLVGTSPPTATLPLTLPLGGSTFVSALEKLINAILDLANATGMDLTSCVIGKLRLNALKYPVKLCKGRAGKYTDYTSVTGIDQSVESQQQDEKQQQQQQQQQKHQQNTQTAVTPEISSSRKRKSGEEGSVSSSVPILSLIEMVNNFVDERDWSKFHTPRNIALALLGEAGELCEIFQWLGDEDSGKVDVKGKWEEKERTHLGQELADVTIYAIRLATLQGVDLVK
mmetsp:Transcript_14160/g.29098  ORF Transcript_14160/g.29098 Transcript_14160/m.29098 type:complete len:283 (+) Transcript_14160:63-911(+)